MVANRWRSSARARFPTFAMVMGVLLLAAISIGANCNRPPPTCFNCAPGRVIACRQNCVAPRNADEPCSLDPCAEDGTCVDGTTCLPSGTGNALTCRSSVFGTGGGAQCDSHLSANTCGAELFCKDSVKCNTGSPDRCGLFSLEGSPCDSNANFPNCSPCQPGTVCTIGVCRKTCATTAECDTNQCDPGRRCIDVTTLPGNPKSTVTTSGVGECFHCAAKLHDSCDVNSPCCGPGQVCAIAFGNSCCMAVGATTSQGSPCTSLADCCGAFVNPAVHCTDLVGTGDRRCLACTVTGSSCNTDADCCTTLCTGTCVCRAQGEKCSQSAECCTANCLDNGTCGVVRPPPPPPQGDAGAGDAGALNCARPGAICGTGAGNVCCAGLHCNDTNHCDCGAVGVSCDVPGGNNGVGQLNQLCCPGLGCTAAKKCGQCQNLHGSCSGSGCCADQGDCVQLFTSSLPSCEILPTTCRQTGEQCRFPRGNGGGPITISCCGNNPPPSPPTFPCPNFRDRCP